jgi:hypothetical protein
VPGYRGQDINAYSSKARYRLTLKKVNYRGRELTRGQYIKGTGSSLSAQYNPESLRFGKKVQSKENQAAGEYTPPVELLGGNANTLSFVLRLNAYGEADPIPAREGVKKLEDMYAFMPYREVKNPLVGQRVFHNVDIMQGLYDQIIFLDSLQYPNPVSRGYGKFLRTPLIKIIFGYHVPLIWALDDIRFDIKQFDPDLNIQRADVDISFKMASCYYNYDMFRGTVPSPFFNLLHSFRGRLTREDRRSLTMTKKYMQLAKLIPGD